MEQELAAIFYRSTVGTIGKVCTCYKVGPQAWYSLVKFLIPEACENFNICQNLIEDLRDQKVADEFDNNTLFWKSIEKQLCESLERNYETIYHYMTDRSPRMYVNSPLNLLPKFMALMMKVFNWEIVAKDKYFLVLTKNHTFIKHGQGEIFVRFPVGRHNQKEMHKQLAPFLDMVILSDVNTVFLKTEGTPDFVYTCPDWNRVVETRYVEQPPIGDPETSQKRYRTKEVEFYYGADMSINNMRTEKLIYVPPTISTLTDPQKELSPTEKFFIDRNILTVKDFTETEEKPFYIMMTTFSSAVANYRPRDIKRSPVPPPFHSK